MNLRERVILKFVVFALVFSCLNSLAFSQNRSEVIQTFNRALDLAKDHRYEESISMYKQALSEAKKIGTDGEDISDRIKKQLPVVLYQAALLNYKRFQKQKTLSEVEHTISSFREASNLSSELESPRIAQKADRIVTQLMYTKSLLQYKNFDSKSALVTLDNVIQKDPNFAKAYYQKGIILKEQKGNNIDKAKSMFEKAIELGKESNDYDLVKRADEAYDDIADSMKITDNSESYESKSEQDNSKTELNWKTLKVYSGDSSTNTSPFEVQAEYFKVEYTSKLSKQYEQVGPQVHLFTATIKTPNDSFQETVANETNQRVISGSSYVYKSGLFYFDVSATHGNWEIKVIIPQ